MFVQSRMEACEGVSLSPKLGDLKDFFETGQQQRHDRLVFHMLVEDRHPESEEILFREVHEKIGISARDLFHHDQIHRRGDDISNHVDSPSYHSECRNPPLRMTPQLHSKSVPIHCRNRFHVRRTDSSKCLWLGESLRRDEDVDRRC